VRLVVGGPKGLAGGGWLRGRLCWGGSERNAWHPRFDIPSGLAEPAPWYVYERAATGIPVRVFRWFPMLPIGMATVGIGSMRTGALGGWGLLPLVMGLLGEAYLFTDLGVPRIGYAYVMFGLVYSLGWIVLGCLLWPKRTATNPHTSSA
jgi:hypothetical protein